MFKIIFIIVQHKFRACTTHKPTANTMSLCRQIIIRTTTSVHTWLMHIKLSVQFSAEKASIIILLAPNRYTQTHFSLLPAVVVVVVIILSHFIFIFIIRLCSLFFILSPRRLCSAHWAPRNNSWHRHTSPYM